MAVRSRDFVGVAEGIRSHELSTKSQIENLKGHMSELSGRRSSLNSTISYLEAAIAAAYEDTDEDGDPDYGLIASLEAEKSSAENELSGVEQDLDSTGSELESKQNELEAVEEEKVQALFEIQERARKTSQNISLAGGMYGAYAGVGGTLQNSLQTSLSSLTQAAGILGGSVDGASGGSLGNSSSGSGRSASGEAGTSSGVGNTETGALSAFTGGYSGETLPLPTSQFSTSQDQLSTPATMPNFHSGQGTINPKAPQSFTSEQNANAYALDSFAASPEDAPTLPGVTEYLSWQESQSAQCAFKSKNSQTQPNSGKTSVHEGNYRSAQETQGFSGFIGATQTAPMIARHGRNPFIDSLIVQNWELGRYSDSRMSSFRKQAAQSDYAAYIKNPRDYRHISYDKKPVIYIDPATINEIRGIDDPNFWSYKSTPYSSYIDMARQIPLVYSMTKAGQKLTDLAKRDDVIGACARNYFLNDDITVMRVGNGYVFGGEGRHRIMAALIAGVNIPVRVTDDFIKNETSPSIAKKQLETLTEKERIFADWLNPENYQNGHYIGTNQTCGYKPYGNDSNEYRATILTPRQQAFHNYMQAHNYGKSDFSIYSKDPEWQRLHKIAYPNNYSQNGQYQYGNIVQSEHITCRTEFDNSVRDLSINTNLNDSLKETFYNKQYRTVVTTEDIKLYRIYGGASKKEGVFLTSQMPTDRMATKMGLALKSDWKNNRENYCEVIIPKGTILNIGKAAPQISTSGYVLPGGMEQIVISKDFVDENAKNFGIPKKLEFKTGYKEFEKKAQAIESQIKDDNKKFAESALYEMDIRQKALEELTEDFTSFMDSSKAYAEICWMPKEHELDLAMAKADVLSNGFSTILVSICLLAATIKNDLKM